MSDLPDSVFETIVSVALAEDIGAGDVTTEACVSPETKASASGVARGELVVAGVPVVARVFERMDKSLRVEAVAAEGSKVGLGATIFRVSGSARAILTGERVALNFLQRMCGIATMTRRFVDALPAGSHTRITDTRKTTPGLRVLERYAVRRGGGHNHRNDLGSAVLIKDNHIVAAGGVTNAIRAARARAPHTSRIECEVDTMVQLDEALAAGADIILLDNMDTAAVREAVGRARGKAILEASGSVTLGRVHDLAAAGVDAISVGALTHSVQSADIGLDFSS